MTSPALLEGVIIDFLSNADSLLQKVICLYAVNKYRDELICEIADSIADEVRKGAHGASERAESSAEDAELERVIRKVLPGIRQDVLQKVQTAAAVSSDRV